MDQVITFNKSLQERLQEFNEVFSGSEVLPARLIKNEWTFYLELTVDPNGWQAIWKIPRLTCEDLNIPFPSVVLVLVLNVDYQNLSALVRVLAVQDDISIPKKHTAPLSQLWPLKGQDKSVALNMHSTANALDMLRFFYIYIYMPWDNEDDNVDWKSTHLESRLRLYYDLKTGNIPRAAAVYIHSILEEARRLNGRKERIEAQLTNEEDDISDNNNEKVASLIDIHLRLIEIKNEIDLMENPVFRNAVIKKRMDLFPQSNNGMQQIWVVCDGGSINEYLSFLAEVKEHYPSESLTVTTDLASRLETSNSGDSFVLSKSEHVIRTAGALENGGLLKGVGFRDDIILTSKIDGIMLDFIGGAVTIENVTIHAKYSQCAILFRNGKGILKNCKIVGSETSSRHQGILVLATATLELIDCEITGFFTSIVGNTDSTILIKNSKISNANCGIRIYDNCNMKIENSVISNCQEFGIVLETEDTTNLDDRRIGNFETLKSIPDITIENIKGENNVKGDVAINKTNKLQPVEDLFANPDFDPTLIESSDDEDMSTHEIVE